MSTRRANPFSRGAVLGIVVIGFTAFIAMLYFLSVGDTGGNENNGQGHAASNGLPGYTAITRLLDKEGYDVSRSREESNLDGRGLLVLTPPAGADAEDISRILRRRAYIGPTMVIVPKWYTSDFPPTLDSEVSKDIKQGWVQLAGADVPEWLGELEEPYAIEAKLVGKNDGNVRWQGLSASGSLPTPSSIGAESVGSKYTLITDDAGRSLAVSFDNRDEFGNTEDTEPVTFVLEPDLMNNYGMSDKNRAALAMRVFEEASYGPEDPVTFDLTLNGMGATVNLLTLAFRPPFLAATLCLILAMLIVGWRAFKRFGPAVAGGTVAAFGKSRLVANGAGLIVRAKRLRLLADPYANLSARRLAQALGLAKPDPAKIDEALARRLPDEEPFSLRADRLRAATSSTEILRAAQALKELEGKLSK